MNFVDISQLGGECGIVIFLSPDEESALRLWINKTPAVDFPAELDELWERYV